MNKPEKFIVIRTVICGLGIASLSSKTEKHQAN
jgi:hypothetical protein